MGLATELSNSDTQGCKVKVNWPTGKVPDDCEFHSFTVFTDSDWQSLERFTGSQSLARCYDSLTVPACPSHKSRGTCWPNSNLEPGSSEAATGHFGWSEAATGQGLELLARPGQPAMRYRTYLLFDLYLWSGMNLPSVGRTAWAEAIHCMWALRIEMNDNMWCLAAFKDTHYLLSGKS